MSEDDAQNFRAGRPERVGHSVGSTNFDMRSFELNDEASLNVYDQAFAVQMTQVFERDLLSSSAFTLEEWRAFQKLAEIVLLPVRSQL